jgi:hypothetical protein
MDFSIAVFSDRWWYSRHGDYMNIAGAMFFGFRDTGTTVLHTNRRPAALPCVGNVESLRPLQRGGGFC